MLSRIDAHQEELGFKTLDLGALVRAAVEPLRALAERGDVELAVETPEGAATISGDAAHLERAVRNVVKNAVEVSPKGGTVTVRVTAAGGRALVSVADQGPGMTPAQADHLRPLLPSGHGARVGGRQRPRPRHRRLDRACSRRRDHRRERCGRRASRRRGRDADDDQPPAGPPLLTGAALPRPSSSAAAARPAARSAAPGRAARAASAAAPSAAARSRPRPRGAARGPPPGCGSSPRASPPGRR